MDILIGFLALGMVAGFFAGLLGIGGGLIVVPGLLYLFANMGWSPSISMHMALGSSLAMIIFTALSTTYAHHRKNNINWAIVKKLAPSLAVGAFAGASAASFLNTVILTQIFAAFIGLISVHLFWDGSRHQRSDIKPRSILLSLLGIVVGFLSTLLGLGGGVLLVPILNRLDLQMRQVVAISGVCTFPVALVGALSYIFWGWNVSGLPQEATGYVFWPAVGLLAIGSMLIAPLGVHAAHHMPGHRLRQIFAFFLLLISLRMWWLSGAGI